MARGNFNGQQAKRSTTCLLGLALVLFSFVGSTCDALRMLNLDVPEFVSQGDTINLSCFFSLQNSSRSHSKLADLSAPPEVSKQDESAQLLSRPQGEGDGLEPLYAIKWYKDEREFFRYMANGEPKKRAFPFEGVTVDVAESGDQTIKLTNVSLKTGGLYKCEVSTDAPFFVTKYITRKLSVFSLPNEGPVIELLKPAPTSSRSSPIDVAQGDKLELLCWSHESKPAASLHWIINDSLNLSAIFTQSGASQQANREHWLDIKHESEPVGSPSIDSLPATSLSLSQRPQAVPGERPTPIEYLVEKSTSQLRLAIDSNLLQLLGVSKVPPPPAKFKSRRSLDNQAFILISSNPIQINNPVVESSQSPGTGNSEASTKKPKKNKSSKSQATLKDRQDAGNHLALIEIKCTATMLQLQMSDKIKLQLIDKSGDKSSKRKTGALNGVQGARTKERKSHSSSSATGTQQHGILTLISTVAISFVCLWREKDLENFKMSL